MVFVLLLQEIKYKKWGVSSEGNNKHGKKAN